MKRELDFHLVAVIALSLICAVAIVSVYIFNPAGSSGIITLILGFFAPTIAAVLAGMVRNIHKDVNSRMTELLDLTQKAATAEGKLEGQDMIVRPAKKGKK